MRLPIFIYAFVILTLFGGISPAKADCTLQSTGQTRSEGAVVYNQDHDVLMVCAGTTWQAVGFMGGGGGGGPPVCTADNWVAQTAAENNQWRYVAYGAGRFVAVADTGTNRVMTSTDGVNWAVAPGPVPSGSWFSVVYGGGQFVAVGMAGGANQVMTSPDGLSWTAQTPPVVRSWAGITYGAGKYVAVAIDGDSNRVMTSPDGVTWTLRSVPEANNFYSVAYLNGKFIATSINGTNQIMTSPDGETWTMRAAPQANQWRGHIAYGNGKYVTLSQNGTNRVMTSTDGETWVSATGTVPANSWRGLIFVNDRFIALAYNGGATHVMTSTDGDNWVTNSVPTGFWYSLAYGDGKLVAIGGTSGPNYVMTSECGPPVVADACETGPVGTACADGAIYAGDSPDDGARMYMSPSDDSAGASWNNDTNTWQDTAMTNCTPATGAQASCAEGEDNTTLLYNLGTSPSPAPYMAARICRDKGAEWYLPSIKEWAAIGNNAVALGGFSDTIYWSSSENTASHAWLHEPDYLFSVTNAKDMWHAVRCVRK